MPSLLKNLQRRIRGAAMAVIFAIIAVATHAVAQPAPTVSGIPQGPARDKLVTIAQTFNELWGSDVVLQSIKGVGTVSDIAVTTKKMMAPAVLPDIDPDTQKLRLHVTDAAGLIALDATKASLLRDSLRLNLTPGDYLVVVRLKDLASGTVTESWNTVRPDGQVFSGVFFGTFRGGPGTITRYKRANTVCDDRVLTTYLWGSPAEYVRACVRATCEGGVCVECYLTEANAFAGFFAELEVRPKDLPPPISGTITADNCCLSGVAWAWATGFKSIKVGADGKTLEVEGRIGQGTNGFFSVEECCRGNERPINDDTSTPSDPSIQGKDKLSFPGDCRRNTLMRAAAKDGCSTEEGGNHTNVKKGGQTITQIPRAVKANGTCREIIKVLNEQCLQ